MARLLLCVLALVLIGCSSSSGTNPGTGNLTISIAAPAGVAASVAVTGPQGYKKTVTSTTTLTGVPAGSYTLTAATVVGADSIVAIAYGGVVSGSPASVSAGGTATVTVSYSARGGTGALWVVGGLPYANGSVQSVALGYGSSQLHTGALGSPSVTLSLSSTPGGNINASSVAVDSAGNLWVANQNTHAVVKYTPDALVVTGAPSPAATVTMADSSGTVALAFDSKGNLWVVNQYAGTINELTPSELVTGTPSPVVTIQDGLHGSLSNQQGNNPIAMAFDSAGNLWIANPGASNVIEYAAGQLTSSGSQSPAVTLSPGTPSSVIDTAFNTPYALAFDHQGNLWVAMAAGSFFEFPPSALTTSGVPTARMKLTPPQAPGHTPFPVAVAFDNSGNLWFGMLTGSIGEYTAAQVAAGGNPPPAVMVKLSPSLSPTAIAFDPHSPGLPLH